MGEGNDVWGSLSGFIGSLGETYVSAVQATQSNPYPNTSGSNPSGALVGQPTQPVLNQNAFSFGGKSISLGLIAALLIGILLLKKVF